MVLLYVIVAIYGAFLVWHEPWFSRRLKPGEAASLLHGKYEEMEETDPQERRAIEAFMDADDGRFSIWRPPTLEVDNDLEAEF